MDPKFIERQVIGDDHRGEIRKFPRKKHIRIRVGQLVRLEKGYLVVAKSDEDVLGVVSPTPKPRRLVSVWII